MKVTLSALTFTALIVFSIAGGAVVATFSNLSSSASSPFTIDASVLYGVNEYTLIEVDEGDNDEEEVIILKLHEFYFDSFNANGIVVWDFGDGNSATGSSASHSFQEPGYYTITATSSSSKGIYLSSVGIIVEMTGYVESDNMECVCAPSAKSTVIDLVPSIPLLVQPARTEVSIINTIIIGFSLFMSFG